MSTATLTLPKESTRSQVDKTLGMVLFLGSWTMAFLTLFLSFLVVRGRQPAWPPAGVVLPSAQLALFGTLLLLASSLVLHAAVVRGRQGRAGFLSLWSLAGALGLAFAVLQTRLWLDLWSAGSRPETGVYESLFFALTWFHAAHVVCGLLGLGLVLVGGATGRYSAARISTPVNIALFWHFVGAVWLVLFLALFVF